ncbi:MAG: Ribose-5-phosphate isomerase B [Parcubacteria group bacterium GW2011_GWC2_36_17]|nr:MAG: Ribose-5-phosphate isomerase B [Parcubacteria group bacterium GW2011_GWC2_36_17]
MGNFVYDENDDYPDWIFLAAHAVAEDLKNGVDSKAIVFGGSGQGEAIVANRVPGIRAAVLYNYNEDIIKLSREHNDANILSLGARFISEEDAKKAVKAWIETEFSREERHQRRIEKF